VVGDHMFDIELDAGTATGTKGIHRLQQSH
jgi:hypothetical protein